MLAVTTYFMPCFELSCKHDASSTAATRPASFFSGSHVHVSIGGRRSDRECSRSKKKPGARHHATGSLDASSTPTKPNYFSSSHAHVSIGDAAATDRDYSGTKKKPTQHGTAAFSRRRLP
jgi:hypothetical protein